VQRVCSRDPAAWEGRALITRSSHSIPAKGHSLSLQNGASRHCKERLQLELPSFAPKPASLLLGSLRVRRLGRSAGALTDIPAYASYPVPSALPTPQHLVPPWPAHRPWGGAPSRERTSLGGTQRTKSGGSGARQRSDRRPIPRSSRPGARQTRLCATPSGPGWGPGDGRHVVQTWRIRRASALLLFVLGRFRWCS
jgi:hypothetical protein